MQHHTIKANLQAIMSYIMAQDLPTQVQLQNEVKQQLHEISPFKNEPVDCVIWVPGADVIANDYNPNSVAPPEMQLLEEVFENENFSAAWESAIHAQEPVTDIEFETNEPLIDRQFETSNTLQSD